MKTFANSTLKRFKARLVARGFSQIYSEDYDKTFALIVRTNTLRVFLAIVAAKDQEYRQYNVKNAFIKALLRERIYLSLLKVVFITLGFSLRVLRSLYGLKQLVRDQNTLYKNELKKLSFKQSLADLYIFVYNNKEITLLVYINNIAAAIKTNKDLTQFFNTFR